MVCYVFAAGRTMYQYLKLVVEVGGVRALVGCLPIPIPDAVASLPQLANNVLICYTYKIKVSMRPCC